MVKGYDISVIDLKNQTNFICDYFVLCNGNSKNQVFAISRSIENRTIDKLQEKPWHIEGVKNGEWVLIDYVSIVVHIFQKEVRLHYDIESIWK
ncbi:ribosome silencing factor [Blattabacterium cuenoti]|uniref:ribosome silencing factor n=1 Tax=Blattabacterium cuenoti TaxID=1653831 RepID=UPI00163D1571|nr:ribosome silencing factor [Blattabacterium cuenoti]